MVVLRTCDRTTKRWCRRRRTGWRGSAGFWLAPVDSTARPQILAIWRQFTEKETGPCPDRFLAAASGPATRRWPVPLDRVYQFAVLAVLALYVDRNDGMQWRNEEGDGKNKTEQDAG